jgi:predicted DNA-binding transcriptional regulator YafY
VRRADRLFEIIQLLRRRRVMTAEALAERLEVSVRTVYRDLRDLERAGTPIRGEAGVGYTLARDYDLPPLMFDEEELEALVVGARVVAGFADPALGAAAGRALAKIESVLPPRLRGRVEGTLLFTPGVVLSAEMTRHLPLLREAISTRRRVTLDYARDGEQSRRVVRPLGAWFWGKTWTLATWCELRQGFRNLRLDRIQAVELGPPFEPEPGRTLEDFLAEVRAEQAGA